MGLAAETTESLQRNNAFKETQVPNREAQVDFIIVIRMYRHISTLILISFLKFSIGAARY